MIVLGIDELKARTRELAKRMNAVILAHNYQRPEIQDVADFCGDSLDLAMKAYRTKADYILFCGVDFMAETAAALNPGKTVLMPDVTARCPMAGMLPREAVVKAKREHPDAGVVLYINTLAEAKAEADIVCTSANAVRIVKSLPEKKILFGPDENLAYFVQKRLPEKQITPIPAHGFCVVHKSLLLKWQFDLMKSEHPGAVLLAHPECNPDVQEMADFVLSTNGMVEKVRELPDKEFIIGTEEGLAYRLRKENPGKKFYVVDTAVCVNMKKHTLEKAYKALMERKPVVTVPEEIAEKVRVVTERMLNLTI